MKRQARLLLIATLALLGCGATEEGQDEEAVGAAAERLVELVGTTTLGNATEGDGADDSGGIILFSGPEGIKPVAPLDPSFEPPHQAPSPPVKAITRPGPSLSGFDGLTDLEQRSAGVGIYSNSQFDTEPPDPVVCVGNGFVVEVVNDAIAVYDPSGKQLVPAVPLNAFFLLPPAINRRSGRFGPFVSDPKCHFDADTGRFFVTALEIDVDPVTGAFGNRSHVELAVSQTGDPRGGYFIFAIDVTSSGDLGTPALPGCPCFGDQPLLGMDKNGVYISTNEFSLDTLAFQGAQIYALSKRNLVKGVASRAIVFPDIPLGLGEGSSIQPALAPPDSAFATVKRGTEYFLSSLSTDELQDHIAVWALTNTASLNEAAPSLSLRHIIIDSEVYGQPSPVEQKNGPRPLGRDFLPHDLGLPPEPLERLDSGDDRMQQVYFADMLLWSALTTVIDTGTDDVRAGAAYFIVKPSFDALGKLRAEVVNQGYIVAGDIDNVIYPAVAVNKSGKGAVAYTLVGPDRFPSAAYSTIDAVGGAGDVKVASLGVAPEDGFTGYRAFGGDGVARWGDYSGAAVDKDGSIRMSMEYISPKPRSTFANWGTFIARVAP